MKLDQLPVEMLMKIVNYLASSSEISLVNKLFHDVTRKVNDSNICLRINRQFFVPYLSCNVPSSQWHWLKSIQQTNRQISKMRIICEKPPVKEGDRRRVISVVEKFSATIKYLKLTSVESKRFLLEILSLTPNVEHLDLANIYFDVEDQASKQQCCNYNLNLNRLKLLSIADGRSDDFIRILCCLPVNVITELHIDSCWNVLLAVLDRQINIKKLVLKNITGVGATEVFEKLKLETLELSALALSSVTIAAILSKQQKLKYLTISAVAKVDENLMNAVAKLMELERLTMSVWDIPVGYFLRIRKLPMLQEFNFECNNVKSSTLPTFAELDDTLIRKLSLSCQITSSVDLVSVLAETAPHLKQFKLTIFKAFNSTILVSSREMDVILRHFTCAVALKFEIEKEPSDSVASRYFNPKLSELKISEKGHRPYFEMWLKKLTASYPNLKKLRLKTNSSSHSLEIRPILDGFTKLESLKIKGRHPGTIEDLDYLCSYKGSLKFMSWNYSEENTPTDEFVKELRAWFGLVRIAHHSRRVYVAVDRYAMNCKCLEIERRCL